MTVFAGVLATSACAGAVSESPRAVAPAAVVAHEELTQLRHGTRVRVLLSETSEDWLYGVLSLEGECVVWLRDRPGFGRYIDLARVFRITVSNVQHEPRGGWPLGIIGPVPGESWTEVNRPVLNGVLRRCASSHVS